MTILLIILSIIICIPLIYIAVAFINSLVLYHKRPFKKLLKKRRAQTDYVCLDELPDRSIEAVLALEDKNFYKHKGIDFKAIRTSIVANIKAGHIIFGGSTIDQQLAKNLYFHFRHSLFRKLSELFIVIRMNREVEKDDILEMYINVVYFGNGIYGMYNASIFYYGKVPRELTVNQMFSLFCLLAEPTKANPYRNPERLIERRNRKAGVVFWKDKPMIEEIKSYSIEMLCSELVPRDDIENQSKASPVMLNERFGRSWC